MFSYLPILIKWEQEKKKYLVAAAEANAPVISNSTPMGVRMFWSSVPRVGPARVGLQGLIDLRIGKPANEPMPANSKPMVDSHRYCYRC